MNKPKPTTEEKQKLAGLTAELISEFVRFVREKDVDTFDLRDIREMIFVQSLYGSEIAEFKRAFNLMWTVWPNVDPDIETR